MYQCENFVTTFSVQTINFISHQGMKLYNRLQEVTVSHKHRKLKSVELVAAKHRTWVHALDHVSFVEII